MIVVDQQKQQQEDDDDGEEKQQRQQQAGQGGGAGHTARYLALGMSSRRLTNMTPRGGGMGSLLLRRLYATVDQLRGVRWL